MKRSKVFGGKRKRLHGGTCRVVRRGERRECGGNKKIIRFDSFFLFSFI